MTPATRTRLAPDARRDQLVAIALELLSDRALHDLSIDEVAAAAGISKALVFHYFGSKAEFQLAVARAAADDFIAVTEPDPTLPIDEQLEQSMQAFVSYVADNRVGYVMLVRGPANDDDAMRVLFDQTRDRVVDRIVSKLGPIEGMPGFPLTVRGWVAFAEELTTTWVAEPSVSQGELLRLLRESLTALVTVALLPADDAA